MTYPCLKPWIEAFGANTVQVAFLYCIWFVLASSKREWNIPRQVISALMLYLHQRLINAYRHFRSAYKNQWHKQKSYKNSPGKHESLTSSILANNGPNLQIQAGITCVQRTRKNIHYTGCFIKKTAPFIFGYNSYNNGPICVKFAANVC